MKCHDALHVIMASIHNEIVVSCVGYTSRELFQVWDRDRNFYLLGAMGLTVPVGFGLAMACDQKVIALEGDGSLLMNLGAIATVSRYKPKNLMIIVLDNKSYSSTGGQASASAFVELRKVLQSFDIETYFVDQESKLKKIIINSLKADGPHILVVQIEKGYREVPRVPLAPKQIARRFIKSVQNKEG